MATIEEVREMMKECNVTDTFGTKKEINELPSILHENEKIKYMTSGYIGNNTWLLVATNKRVIFLDKGMLFGLKMVETPLEQINSIVHKTGLIFGEIEVWDGSSKTQVKNIIKDTVKPFVDAVNQAREDMKEALNSNNSNNSNNPNNSNEAAPNPVDEILRYKELLDQGILTPEEFTAKKKQLLGI